jgi:N-carbamoylputrescine amidase
MTSHPRSVTIGLVQETASNDLAANLERALQRVREAAAQGAQIICLQELFNAPYFCKVIRPDRFDIAEALDGPVVTAMQKLAKELGVGAGGALLRKAGAGTLSQFGDGDRCRRRDPRDVSQDAHPA